VLAWKVSCQGLSGGGFPGGRFHSGRFLGGGLLGGGDLEGHNDKSSYGASPPRPAPLTFRMGAQELEPVLEAPRASGGLVPSLVGILDRNHLRLGIPPRISEQQCWHVPRLREAGTHSAIRWDCGDMLDTMTRGRKRSYTQADLAEVADGLGRLLDTINRAS